ncbi:tRNA pseudouridine(55) synthase TruB [Desulfovibrio ferrophilus]|uniref:tRNA pseudouridine synthase B n=1 Tax=Desulfovibrio ferrophilus TaxID=241368 RepID=A0A2Z6AXD7_9BACT|nr:tRNA pseudouridine(55) synthase TruB [Desulfovibrio ferrophilus]BBD07922.1 tRNA pseudouridine synthase B [Desulfovibrio ferrophilus]
MGRSRKRSKEQLDGLLVLNKPEGPTSAGCLTMIKRGLHQGKIGHAGTLDPMATGVLLVLLGHGTKLAPYLTEGRKTYWGELELGTVTDSYDRQGKIVEQKPFDHLPPEDVRKDVLSWMELSTQEVPPVSAAKHQGKPLYELARTGQEVPVKVKDIEIFHAEVLEMDLPRVRFRTTVSAGTYVRSLVHSLGIRLGCGAMLTALTREHCHPFGLDQAHDLETVLDESERFPERVISLVDALPHWPKVVVTADQAAQVQNGTWLPVTDTTLAGVPGDKAMIIDSGNTPLALVEAKEKEGSVSWSILRGLW